MSKIVKNVKKLSTIVKIVNIVKKSCQNVGQVCFLITLIKCLKGHKSLGSLCNVKSKSTVTLVSDSVSDKVTYWAVVDS